MPPTPEPFYIKHRKKLVALIIAAVAMIFGVQLGVIGPGDGDAEFGAPATGTTVPTGTTGGGE